MSMGPLEPGSVPAWAPPLLVVAAALLSFGVAVRLVRPRGAWGRQLRSRLLLGVPWGTLLTVLGVVAVYLFVQGGNRHLYDPLVVPFRAWSYFYPLGILAASFTHGGLGHLTGNVLGTLAFAPIAEYAFGHFPTGRGSQSFAGLRSNPYARIFAVPIASVVVGVLAGMFAIGPVIGFSGVLFAIAGFALVFYPIPTVVAMAGGQVLGLLYRAIRTPVLEVEVSTRVITPWWATVAIQGHALGLLLGVLLAGYVAARRDHRPPAGRLWLATVVFAVVESLWAIYWFRGDGQFVLFRAAGAIAVFLLAAVIATALTSSDRPLLDGIGLPRRTAAVGLLVAVTVAISAPAVIPNLAVVEDTSGIDGVEIQDYTVAYAENVPNQQVSVVNVSAFGETTQVNTSGVIVISERRNVFQPVVSKPRLATNGRASVVVGGLGWRESVVANRTGWRILGNESVYAVRLRPSDGDSQLAYSSGQSTVDGRIDGKRIDLAPTAEGFEVRVARGNRTVGTAPVPTPGRNATAGGVRFNRTGKDVYAIANGTRIRVASRETAS